MTALFLPRRQLDLLLVNIVASGYRLIGPQEKDSAIVYDDLQSSTQLPQGLIDRQAPGRYSLEKVPGSLRWFSWVSGPQGLKPFLFKPREYLWQAQRDSQGKLQFVSSLKTDKPEKPLAILGLRACDLAALALQDKHFLQSDYKDPYYANHRASLFVVAINCSRSAETCFCASTGDGPEVQHGFDILLTELDDGFVLKSGSGQAEKIMQAYTHDHGPLKKATKQQLNIAASQIQTATESQQRRMPDTKVFAMEQLALDDPSWQTIATDCLSCGNCTSVCPTCFCHNQREEPDLSGEYISHYRQWSSCFTQEHSYMHGIVIRSDTQLRYKQWFVHKLVSWHQQYARSGCVGCGRCITWCPVGIDITKQAAMIFDQRNHDSSSDRHSPS